MDENGYRWVNTFEGDLVGCERNGNKAAKFPTVKTKVNEPQSDVWATGKSTSQEDTGSG